MEAQYCLLTIETFMTKFSGVESNTSVIQHLCSSAKQNNYYNHLSHHDGLSFNILNKPLVTQLIF